MKPAPDAWQKLAACAARPPVEGAAAPPWFAARVVARWRAGELPLPISPWEVLSLRSVAVAVLVLLLALTANYEVVHEPFAQSDVPVDLLLAAIEEP